MLKYLLSNSAKLGAVLKTFRDCIQASVAIEASLLMLATPIVAASYCGVFQQQELRRNVMFVAMAGMRACTSNSHRLSRNQSITNARAAMASTVAMYDGQGITFSDPSVTFNAGPTGVCIIQVSGWEYTWAPLFGQEPTKTVVIEIIG
jgi:hypothetical protein